MMTPATPLYHDIVHPSARLSSLPSSPSLDIAAILTEEGSAFEDLELLATSLSFAGTSSDDESNLEDVPPFPKDHRPPIFTIPDHRTPVLFAVRPAIASLGDIHVDELAARNVLSAPTIPRMNVVMKEQLFMQTWVESLIPQGPPMHVPWTGDRPVPRRKWISEGLIFPAETFHSRTREIRQTRMVQLTANWPSKSTAPRSAPSCIGDHTKTAVISKECHGHRTGSEPLSVRAFESEPDAPIYGRKKKWAQGTSESPIPKPCSDETIKKLSSTCCDAPRPLPPLGSSPTLAIRRGKKVSGLQLKKNLDNMEYPDLPTPFRGSPTVWSPKFDPGISSPNGELFTDHHSMLSSLRSQHAALASGISTPTTYESKGWQAVPMDSDMVSVTSKPSSSGDDEWAFEKDLAVVAEDLQGHVDNMTLPPPSFMFELAPKRPRKSPNDRYSTHDSPIRSASSPGPRSLVPFVKVSPVPLNRPPCVTLPPCPVLINLSPPPRVKGILKMVKSVRFEDVRRSPDASPLVPSVQEFSTAVKRPSPLRNSFTAPLSAARNTSADIGTETRPKPKGDQVPAIMKSKLVPRSRCVSELPALRRVDTNVRHEIPPAPATFTLGRHSDFANADNENGRAALTHARKPWTTINEKDLRIGGNVRTPKGRLPLRNILKFN